MSNPIICATRRVWLQGILLFLCIAGATLLYNRLQLPEQLEQGIVAGCYIQLIATGQDALIRRDTTESKGKDSKS